MSHGVLVEDDDPATQALLRVLIDAAPELRAVVRSDADPERRKVDIVLCLVHGTALAASDLVARTRARWPQAVICVLHRGSGGEVPHADLTAHSGSVDILVLLEQATQLSVASRDGRRTPSGPAPAIELDAEPPPSAVVPLPAHLERAHP